MGRAPRTVEDVVEDLGFGHAQLRVAIMAYGIWFVEGTQISMAMTLATATSQTLELTSSQRASLSSIIFIGITLGTLLGGYLSDKYGRRGPLLLSYAVASLSQLIVSVAGSYWLVAVLRFCIGVGHGLGMPASLAYVSEVSPKAWRVRLQGMRGIIFTCGGIYTSLICIIDDPSTIAVLHWRTLFCMSSLPLIVLGLLARLFLKESPVFLANTGRHVAARESLNYLRHLNGRMNEGQGRVEINYEPQATAASAGQATGGRGWKELHTVFNRHLIGVTATLAIGSFILNIVLYGHMYAFPKVLDVVKSEVKPGYQALLQNTIGIPIGICVAIVADLIGCKTILHLAFVFGIVGPLSLVWTGSMQNRTHLQEALYLVAQNLPGLAASCGFLACFQLAVDLFPAFAAATSAAVCVATGRVGSMLAPFLYEALGHWQPFYKMISILSGCALALTMLVLSGDQRYRLEAVALLAAKEDHP